MEMEIDGGGCTSTEGRGKGKGKRELPHSQNNSEPSSPCGSKRRVASEDLPNPIPGPAPNPEPKLEDFDDSWEFALAYERYLDSCPSVDPGDVFEGPANPIPEPTPKPIPPIESLVDTTSVKDAVADYSFVDSELVKDSNDYERLVFIDHQYWNKYETEYHCFNSYEHDKDYINFFRHLLKEAPETIDIAKLLHKAEELHEARFEKLYQLLILDAHKLLLVLSRCNELSEKFFKAWKRAFKENEGLLVGLAREGFKMGPTSFLNMFGRTLNQISEIDAETDENVARDNIHSIILKDYVPAAGLCVDLTLKKIALAKMEHLI